MLVRFVSVVRFDLLYIFVIYIVDSKFLVGVARGRRH